MIKLQGNAEINTLTLSVEGFSLVLNYYSSKEFIERGRAILISLKVPGTIPTYLTNEAALSTLNDRQSMDVLSMEDLSIPSLIDAFFELISYYRESHG